MKILESAEGGITISFSRRDLENMPRSDYTLLKLFVTSLAEEFEVEKEIVTHDL